MDREARSGQAHVGSGWEAVIGLANSACHVLSGTAEIHPQSVAVTKADASHANEKTRPAKARVRAAFLSFVMTEDRKESVAANDVGIRKSHHPKMGK